MLELQLDRRSAAIRFCLPSNSILKQA